MKNTIVSAIVFGVGKVMQFMVWRGLRPQPNPKLEILNPKQIKMTKNGKSKTEYANERL